MHGRFKKKDFLTIPNAMSLFRLCLIPLIIWIYLGADKPIAAACVIALSALTDVLDGRIARRFNMVSDVGKILDPIADKLTQGSIIICLVAEYHKMLYLIVVFCIKELVMLLLGYLTMHYAGSVNSAKWYGKACTVVLDTSIAAMVLIPHLPEKVIDVITLVCAVAMLMSLTLYTRFYIKLLRSTPLWNEHKKGWTNAYKIITCAVWVAIIVFCIVNRDKFSVNEVLRFTPSNPFLAAIVLMLLFALKSISVVVYCGILYAAGGILFPLPVAILLNILGTAVMVSLPYVVGRENGREYSERVLKKFPKAAVVKDLRDENDFVFALIVRLIGILPCDIVSIYFGACGTNYIKYLIASLIGMMPQIITFPIIGTNVSNMKSPEFLISVGVNAVCVLCSFIACAVIKTRHVRQDKKHNSEESK